jgi:hypothetical protein
MKQSSILLAGTVIFCGFLSGYGGKDSQIGGKAEEKLKLHLIEQTDQTASLTFYPEAEARAELGNVPINADRLNNVIQQVLNELGPPRTIALPAGYTYTKSYKFNGQLSGDSVDLTHHRHRYQLGR